MLTCCLRVRALTNHGALRKNIVRLAPAGITWRACDAPKITGKILMSELAFCPLRAHLTCTAHADVYCVLPMSAFLSSNKGLARQLVKIWYAVLIQHYTFNFTKKRQKRPCV